MCARFGLTEFADDFAQYVALTFLESGYDGPVALHLVFNNWLKTQGPFSVKRRREVPLENFDPFIAEIKKSDVDFELFLNELELEPRVVCTLRIKWGLEISEIAHVMGVSIPTVKRRWHLVERQFNLSRKESAVPKPGPKETDATPHPANQQ